jgi:hypothetical protein
MLDLRRRDQNPGIGKRGTMMLFARQGYPDHQVEATHQVKSRMRREDQPWPGVRLLVPDSVSHLDPDDIARL